MLSISLNRTSDFWPPQIAKIASSSQWDITLLMLDSSLSWRKEVMLWESNMKDNRVMSLRYITSKDTVLQGLIEWDVRQSHQRMNEYKYVIFKKWATPIRSPHQYTTRCDDFSDHLNPFSHACPWNVKRIVHMCSMDGDTSTQG